jgi:hypothetical protein
MKISTATMPMTAARHAGANRIRAQRRPHRALFQILDAAGSAPERRIIDKIFRRLLAHPPAADRSLIANRFLNVSHFLDFVVEHYGQASPT